jgi:hypothetical protein
LKKKESVPFTTEGLILCEGVEDAAVIRQLIKSRVLGISVDIRANADWPSNGGGDGGFAAAISAAEANHGFRNIKKILLVADNDHDPAEKFKNIQQQIDKAYTDPGLSKQWPKPSQPAKFTGGKPAVAVWMWPSAGQHGCLETVLWPAIQQKYPQATPCVDAAMACSGSANWSLSKRHKAAVRCFFSLACEKNPGATLAAIFQDVATAAFVPLEHASLNPMANFLQQNF